MCGIAGFVGWNDRKLIKDMCDIMSYRGPDDSGFYRDKNIELGNRRLSIIDIVGGKQPIHNEDETVWVVYNGEIYNYKELMEELVKKGHKFYTNSDTEVIVHLYEEMGEECVKKLRGMFSFALWDANQEKLILARDPTGIKPLYYSSTNEGLIFSSEIKSILLSGVNKEIDPNALYDFLTFRYISGPSTIFRNIKKLMPGHVLIFCKNKSRIFKYWDFSFKPIDNTEEYYIDNLKKLLEESTKMRMMSEVPLGAYLSGGLDSSLVVAMMSKYVDEPLKTFSIGFDLGEFNELKYARIVSEMIGTEHNEITIGSDSMNILPTVIWHLDEPLADPAAIPTYILSEFAKKKVTVVLTGEGGDEVYAGYEQYKIMLMTKKYGSYLPDFIKRMIPFVVQHTPKTVLDKIFPYSSSLGEEGMKRIINYLKSMDNSLEAYLHIMSIFNDPEKKELLTTGVLKNIENSATREILHKQNHFIGTDILNNMQEIEIKRQLVDNMLMKVDKTTMANSIEARVPLLDQRAVEFAGHIPQKLRMKNMIDKYLIRKIAQSYLPRTITSRKKHRFFVPIHIWLEEGLSNLTDKLFFEEELKRTGHFNYNYIEKIKRNYNRSKLYYGRQMWNLLNFELWYRIFVEGDVRKPKLNLNKII